MTTWTDKTGRTLEVVPAGDDSPARLVIALPGTVNPVAFWLDGEADLAEVAVAMYAANGKPAPVITPRPNLDASGPLEFQGVTLSAEPDRVVRIAMDGGCVFREMAPHAARTLAGALVAYADAAEAEPGPADVERMASLFTEASRMAPEDAARYLLGKGVRLPGGDGGND